jgi:hypothetical protein
LDKVVLGCFCFLGFGLFAGCGCKRVFSVGKRLEKGWFGQSSSCHLWSHLQLRDGFRNVQLIKERLYQKKTSSQEG